MALTALHWSARARLWHAVRYAGGVTPRGVELAIMKMLEARHPRTVCPSEVARGIDGEAWRQLMPAVREAASRLAKRGRVDALQKGEKVDALLARGPIRLRLAAAVDVYRRTDFRRHPELYRVGRGEQGVLTAEPYKSELLPLWRFKSEALARESARALWQAFVGYRRARDFVGMDMARKFLQMGFTRARRYANHRSGRKYAPARGTAPRSVLPVAADEEKARAAAVFYAEWQRAERDRVYAAWRRRMAEQARAGGPARSQAKPSLEAKLSRGSAARGRR